MPAPMPCPVAALQRTTAGLSELLASDPLALLGDGAALGQQIAQLLPQARAAIAADPQRWGA